MTLGEAAATRQFWILCAVQLAVFFCLLTVMIHIVPHATDRGVAPAVAATILSTIGAVSIAGRLTIGTLIDRLGGRRSLAMCFAASSRPGARVNSVKQVSSSSRSS